MHPSTLNLGVAEPLIYVRGFTQSAQGLGQRVVGFGEGGFIGVGDFHSGYLEGPPRLLWTVPVDLLRPLLGYSLALSVPGDEFLGERLSNETIEGLDQLTRGPLRLGHALGEGLLIDGHPEGRHLGDDLDRLILQVDDVLYALTLFHP